MKLYEKFKNLDLDTSLIGLEKGDEEGGYFCTPIGAKVIGWENGGIHYCFIKGFGDMVFAVNPETAEEHYVRPLAENFEIFMSLILACNGTTAAEQISGWDKEQFLHFLEEEDEEFAKKRLPVQQRIQQILGIRSMKEPFEYVKKLQENFDYSKLKFSEEYYDVLGLEHPEGNEITEKKCGDFEAAEIVFYREK